MIDQHLPQVILAPEPFTPRAEVLEVPSLGQKVSDLVSAAIRQGKLADDADTIRRLRVHVNGAPLPADTREERLEAMRYVPQPGEIVNLVVVVQGGGGGGGDKVLQTVLTLAVVALSIWTGGAAGPLASAAPWIRAAASAAVAVGGQMAISAAFAPDNDKLAEANDSGALQDGSNSYRPRAPMPLCLGLRRWAFDLAAPPYTQLIGSDVYLNIALAPHYGRCWVGNLKIGETRLEDYPAGEVAVEYFLDPGVPRRSNLYPNRVVQENFQDKLDKGGAFEVHTTAPNADRGEVDIGLPNGLRWAKSSGKIVPQEVRGRIEVQLVGSGNWVAAQIGQFRDKNNVLLPTGDFYISGKTKDPIRRTFGFDFAQKGQYNVRVRVWNPDSGEPEDELTDTSFWTALRTIERQLPVVDQTLAVIFLRIKSSDDLNGNLPLITGDCEPIVPVYQNGNWNTEARTSNGAALLRWVLMGAAAARPLVSLDFHSSCETTYQLIEANPTWKGALLVTDEKSQQDVMVGLGKMGRFSTFWNGSRLCFVPDWVRETPRQVFSGRNASGYRYRRTFPEPIHAVFVEFLNIAGGTVDDELYVYADGYNAGNTTLIETLKLDFACSPERAFQEGRVYLAKRLLQVEMHEWSAGAEAIATTYGDRVLVRHPATLYGLADGRVVNRFFSGALVSGFRFDDEVEMEAGKTYGIDVRRADGVIRAIPVLTEPGRTNVLKFAAPRSVETSPSKGDLVIFGETGIISEDLEIVDVEPQDDMNVTFRGIPYIADAIAGAINNPIPALPSVITERVPAPRPVVIRPDSAEPEGLIVQATVGPWNGTPLSAFTARFRVTTVDVQEGPSTTPWQAIEPVPAASGIIRTPPITGAAHPPADGQAVTIDLEVRTVLKNGETSLATQISGIPVVANIPTPAAFSALGVKRTSTSDGSSFGAISIQAAPISTGDIQTLEVEVQPAGGGAWVTPTGGLISARNPQGDITGLTSGAPGYKVRARWIRADNWPGPWVESQNAVIPGGSNVSSDTVNVGGVPGTSLADFYTFERPAILDDLEEARATLYTATTGLVAQTAMLFGQLNTPTTGVLARLTTVETRQTTQNTAAVNRLTALETTVNTPTTGVVARLAVAENAISTNNTAAVNRLTALESTINTPLSGVLARLAVQESTTADLVTGKADVARVTLLEAQVSGNPNTLPNPTFSAGFSGYEVEQGAAWTQGNDGTNGIYALSPSGPGTRVLRSSNASRLAVDGNRPYTFSADLNASGMAAADRTYIDIRWWDAAGSAISYSASTWFEGNSAWSRRSITAQSPANAASCYVRIYTLSAQAGSRIRARRLKFEAGSVATSYSEEAGLGSLAARLAIQETATADLYTGKADASRVALVEAVAGNAADGGAMNRNSTFAIWPAGQTMPDNMGAFGSGLTVSKTAGKVSAYGITLEVASGASQVGIEAAWQAANWKGRLPVIFGQTAYWVIDYKIEVGSPTIGNATLRFLLTDAATGATASPVIQPALTSLHTASGDDQILEGSYFFACSPNVNYSAYSGRLAFFARTAAVANYSRHIVHRLSARPATPAEIAAQVALPAVAARVTVTESATADLYGRTRARWAVGSTVPGAAAFIFAQAETTPGQAPTSDVGIGGRTVSIYNSSGDNWLVALKVIGGNVLLSGGLQAGAFIRLGSGDGWPVALQSKAFKAADGGAITFGVNLGSLPSYDFQRDNLLPLGSGETYVLSLTSLTATGGTMSAKIQTPGTPGGVTLNVDTTPGSGPTRQINKASNPDASDGLYTVSINGTHRGRYYDRQNEPTDYSGSMVYGVWAQKSGVWAKVSTITSNIYGLGSGASFGYVNYSRNITVSDTIQMGSNVQAFGVTLDSWGGDNGTSTSGPPTLDDFVSVSWSTPGTPGATRTALASGAQTTVVIRPQN